VGAPYEIAHLSFSKGEHKTPEYLEINPHGSVPALVDEKLKLTESSAILMHLADKFPEKNLAPALGTDARAEYYRWLVYIPATMDPEWDRITMPTRLPPEDKRKPAVVEGAKTRLQTVAKVLERALEGKTYVVGDTFTAADVAVASAIAWMGFVGVLGDHPKL